LIPINGLEDLVHHGLEGNRAVGHSEEHYKRFEEAAVSAEDHFLFISGLDADVEFCKVSSSTELRDKFGDEGERISVLDSHSIQCMIVLDQPKQTIFLLNKEHGGCDGRFGRCKGIALSPPLNYKVTL